MIEKNGKTIVISADDFGISRWADENILKLVRQNKLDRVEIMISDNLKPEQIRELLDSGIKLDIHLHLAKDKLDQWQNNPRVIDSGILRRLFSFSYNYFIGKGVPRKVEKEWERQIVEFQKMFGRVPDGASSHEHIHFFASYFKIILKLCHKYKIGYIRLGKIAFRISGSKVSVILNRLKEKKYPELEKNNISTADIMVSFDWIGNFDEFTNSLPNGKIAEIVFHPELKDEFEFLEKM